jgi:hypothetical protein
VRTFNIHPLTAAIVLTIVFLSALLFLVVCPIVSIYCVWNSLIAAHTFLPPIAPWQAGLLYVAGILTTYILGLVQIEFKTEKID